MLCDVGSLNTETNIHEQHLKVVVEGFQFENEEYLRVLENACACLNRPSSF